jgi:hypothetical protein
LDLRAIELGRGGGDAFASELNLRVLASGQLQRRGQVEGKVLLLVRGVAGLRDG